MALVFSTRLCSFSIKQKFATKLRIQPFPCCAKRYATRKNLLINTASLPVTSAISSIDWLQQVYPVRLYSSTQNDKGEEDPNNEKDKKLSLFQRFKQMYRDYWYVLVPVHLATSAVWFGGFYYLASSGVDISSLLESLNFNERIVNSLRNSSMGYFAIAYALYKIATPVRYTVTLGGTTISINYLKRWGYIKPMPSKERLKEIYTETKEGMKEKRDNLKESVQRVHKTVQETKDGIKETKDSIVSSVKESKQSIKNIKRKVMGNTARKSEDKS